MKKLSDSDLTKVFSNLNLDWNEIAMLQTIKILEAHWMDIAGEVLYQKCRPIFLTESTLTVVTEHSLISQEIDFQKQNWIQKMHTLALPKKIEKIHLKTGKLANYRVS